MKLYYWDARTYGAEETLTTSNSSGVLDMTCENGNVYTTTVAGIAAKNLSDTLYVAAVYSDGAQSHCSGVLAYSIGEYCRTQISAGTEAMQQLAKATAVYGYYAKCYFSENS